MGDARKKLRNIHNGKDVLVISGSHTDVNQTNETYSSLLFKAIFSGAPRGDNLFSYRFPEVLSAGAIPVVHADDWVLPLHHNLVDWSQCIVRIPEAKVNDTVNILREISDNERCRMRRYCYDVYQKWMINPEANIAGMLDSIEKAGMIR